MEETVEPLARERIPLNIYKDTPQVAARTFVLRFLNLLSH
jgi:hypothetical protein